MFIYHSDGLLMVNVLLTVLVAVSGLSLLALDATNIFAQTNMTANNNNATNASNSTMGSSTSNGTSGSPENSTMQTQSGRISGILRGGA